MRKALIVLVIILIILAVYLYLPKGKQIKDENKSKPESSLLSNGLELLRTRKDFQALAIFEQIYIQEQENLDALWGKAEVLRRARKFNESEKLLQEILDKNSSHVPSLISLAYIKYKNNDCAAAKKLLKKAIEAKNVDKGNLALAYVLMGTVNSKLSAKGWLFDKIGYGLQIKCYFIKAKELAPNLPEARLALGSFYLLAPVYAGGDLNKALIEFEAALKIAPEFATVNGRLAQYYKKTGNLEKYNFYVQRVKQLDPENEVLKEIGKETIDHRP